MSTKQRLQKILARFGLASRRDAEALILAGRVSVNGAVVSALGSSADPNCDRIEVDGRPLGGRPQAVVIALHKPAGYVTTTRDDRGRQIVMDLVPRIPGLHPMGRLDFETEGLLLLTNDGGLTVAVTHPRHALEKTYLATVLGRPSADALGRLRAGIALPGGRSAPALVGRLRSFAGDTEISLTIREGRNRQVRRMLSAVGHPVRRLVRIAVGPILLGDLEASHWRSLSTKEVEWLRHLAAGKTSS